MTRRRRKIRGRGSGCGKRRGGLNERKEKMIVTDNKMSMKVQRKERVKKTGEKER